MIAAIYARKSTDQVGVADEQRSIARQVDSATAFARSRGWSIDERFVFVDDNVSGSEFAKRPGFLRLMNSLKPKPTFQILIMSELSRLGREQLETGYALKQLSQAGVRIFSYLEAREVMLDSPTDKFLMSAVNFAAEIEKQKGSQRTSDAMIRKAQAGHVTGGRVFGYDNIRIAKGHVERIINPAEAAVVVRIYEWYANGAGYRHVAHRLNDSGVPAPRAQRGRPSGWDQGTIKAVLERALYRGVIEYGKTKKRDAWGQKKTTTRPASDLIRVEAPQLRLVSPELEAKVDALHADRRGRYLRGTQGPSRPVLGKYVLSGMLRCACGANYEAQKAPHGWRRGDCYVCAAARRKGAAICANRAALPIAETEAAVLRVVERVILTPAFIERVLDTIFVPDDVDRSTLDADRVNLERQMANLTTAIKIGGDLDALVSEVKIIQARLVDVRRRLEPQERADRAQLRAALEHRVDDWKGVLRAHPAQARQVLAHLFNGPIEIRPNDGTQWFDADLDVDDVAGLDGLTPEDCTFTEAEARDAASSLRQIAGLVVWVAETKPSGLYAGLPQVQRLASPAGFEPAFWP